MATGYFDTASANMGFTLRTFYEVKNGIFTITNFQLQSTIYGGSWFPGGTISVNGEIILEMSYQVPATHSFYFFSNGDSFVDIVVHSGESLPVSSEKITSGKAEIAISLKLHRDTSTSKAEVNDTVMVNVPIGLAIINDGSSEAVYQAQIENGIDWGLYQAYLDDGENWHLCEE